METTNENHLLDKIFGYKPKNESEIDFIEKHFKIEYNNRGVIYFSLNEKIIRKINY